MVCSLGLFTYKTSIKENKYYITHPHKVDCNAMCKIIFETWPETLSEHEVWKDISAVELSEHCVKSTVFQ